MKANKLRALWIIIASFALTGWICIQAIARQLLGSISREWVDKTITLYATRILRLVRVQTVVINPLNIKPTPGQPTIIMCNHSSLYDIPISLKVWPNLSIRMLAKFEMSKYPLMGAGMRASGFPFINRHNKVQAIKDLQVMQQLLEDGVVMWIAPEGTRSHDGQLAPFKKGGFITAIQAKATIIPIGIRGANRILPARTHQFYLNQKAEVHVGEPIDASDYSLDNKDELIQRVHEAMQQLVSEPRA